MCKFSVSPHLWYVWSWGWGHSVHSISIILKRYETCYTTYYIICYSTCIVTHITLGYVHYDNVDTKKAELMFPLTRLASARTTRQVAAVVRLGRPFHPPAMAQREFREPIVGGRNQSTIFVV